MRIWVVLNIILISEDGYRTADFNERRGGDLPRMDRCGLAFRRAVVFVRYESWHQRAVRVLPRLVGFHVGRAYTYSLVARLEVSNHHYELANSDTASFRRKHPHYRHSNFTRGIFGLVAASRVTLAWRRPSTLLQIFRAD
jgi:hypothetical protein